MPARDADRTPPNRRGTRAVLRGNVLWLSLVSLLNDAASEMIYPLLPSFLTGTLRAGTTALGAIEGIAESASSLLKLAGGWISDRVARRKPLVLSGYALAAVARPLVAIAAAPWHVLAVRLADRAGKGLRTAPRDALLAESVAAEVRGRAFGVHRAADHVGAVIGPIAASLLLLALGGALRPVFALAAVPGLLAVLVVALRVRERTAPAAGADTGAALERPGLRGLDARFLRYLAVVFVFTLGNASDAFLLLRAGDLGVGLEFVPLLWALHHVSKATWSVPGGALADRIGPRRAIVAGWAVYAATYAGFAYADRAWHAWALFLVYGLFFGLTEAPEKALVAALSAPGRRGRAYGAFHFAIGIGALPASLLFGWIWHAFGAPAAFLVGGALALVAAVALALAVPAPPRARRSAR